MTFSIENALLLGSIMLFLSIIASKTSFRLGIPSLVLFLVVGMLAGSDGPGGIFFNDFKVAKLLGVAALNFILFSGGLETKWESIRPIIWQGLSLSTIGVLITAIGVGVFTSYLMGYSLLEGLLLGAIVSSTDAAAVFSILRSRKVGLKGNLRPLLEFESGSNDPMAYFLTIGVIFLLEHPEATFAGLIPKFFKGMAIGALAGYASGRVMTFVINRIRLDQNETLRLLPGVRATLAGCLDTGSDLSAEERELLARFAGHVRRHLVAENAILLPIARTRLTRADLATLSAHMRARRGLAPVAGGGNAE